MASKPPLVPPSPLALDGRWERATFTVPADVPDERVRGNADKYTRRFGEYLEALGNTVSYMRQPEPDTAPYGEDPDRRRYVIWALCRRRPRAVQLNISEDEIPGLQKLGAIPKDI
ncbi:MAG: hypothetical protein FJ317_07315 [SAR202 cluster bacterium]|nr:hypothetical protein [SAR202 cluster bacterium]